MAVTGVNHHGTPNPAGLLAAIEITYSDGSKQTVVSNTAWKALNSSDIPTGYDQFSYDDSLWLNADTEGAYGSFPWGTITLPLDASCGCSSASS